jgi:hypothetical protein
VGEHLRSDLDEVGLELPVVPFGEHLGDLARWHPESVAQECERFGDELHIGVLDAVVDHLDEVPGPVLPDVSDAGIGGRRSIVRGSRIGRGRSIVRGRRVVRGRHALGSGRDRFEQRAQTLPGSRRSADHERGAVQGTGLSPGDADAAELDARSGQPPAAGDGVLKMRVAAVDDDVTGREHLGEVGDRRVRGGPGIDHEDGHTRPGEPVGEVRRVGDDDEFGIREVLGQLPGTSDIAVIDRDATPGLPREVAGQIRPHHTGPDHSDIGFHLRSPPRRRRC